MEYAKKGISSGFEALTFGWMRYGIRNSMTSWIGTHIVGFQKFEDGIYCWWKEICVKRCNYRFQDASFNQSDSKHISQISIVQIFFIQGDVENKVEKKQQSNCLTRFQKTQQGKMLTRFNKSFHNFNLENKASLMGMKFYNPNKESLGSLNL